MKPVVWSVLPEKSRYEPTEARVTFSRQAKGSPRVFFNALAVSTMKLGKGARVELLRSDAAASPQLGVRLVSEPNRGGTLRESGRTKSLVLVTTALSHLMSYRKIIYKVRPGREAQGEPTWVLDPTSSEKWKGGES